MGRGRGRRLDMNTFNGSDALLSQVICLVTPLFFDAGELQYMLHCLVRAIKGMYNKTAT